MSEYISEKNAIQIPRALLRLNVIGLICLVPVFVVWLLIHPLEIDSVGPWQGALLYLMFIASFFVIPVWLVIVGIMAIVLAVRYQIGSALRYSSSILVAPLSVTVIILLGIIILTLISRLLGY